MRMRLSAVLSVIALAFLMVAPVGAISNGTIDHEHDNVGALLLEVEPGFFVSVCSGSLISETVFLTAAHCLVFVEPEGFDASDLAVTFDVNALEPSTIIPAASYDFDPQFGHSAGHPHDIGVVILAQPVTDIAPVQLPEAGVLNELSKQGGLRGTSFVNVGYGVVPEWKGAPTRFFFDGNRRMSTSPFQSLTNVWLHLQGNSDATGEGGSCFGDSGSPKFLFGTNTIVAITTGGDPNCRAVSYNYRLDTAVARAFLSQYVALP